MPYRDKAKQKACQRAHYLANKPDYVARARAHDAVSLPQVKAWVLSYLRGHPCIDCGETDPVVLEFDHREGAEKAFNVSDAVRSKVALKTVQAEVAKCDVRCANCHRRITHKRRTLAEG